MTAKESGRFVGEIPAGDFSGALEVHAVMTQAGKPNIETEARVVKITERPKHPNVFYNEGELARMREKIREFDWAKAKWEGLKKSADAALERGKDTPPTLGGGWSHDYTCPDDGSRLQFREDKPHAHLCPKCGKEWTDEKRDATWRGNMHGRFIGRAEDLAMAYQISGDAKYAREAIRILSWYADHYAGFPLGKGPAGKGKIMSQSLSESSLLTTLVNASDLAYAAMTREEARKIESGLIRSAAEHVSGYRDHFKIHNIACWHNAAMASAGYFLGDPDLVRRGTEGPYGVREQLAKGVLADGMWYERSLGYHNYTLTALIRHAEAARHNGDDFYKSEALRQMFLAPLRLAFPNLVTPAFNDMGYVTLRLGPGELEVAAAWYGDATALSAMSELYRLGASRNSDYAWHYGEALVKTEGYEPPASADMSGTGVAVLRQGRGKDALCAMLEYGEHGGGHGHPDKLQLLFYGLGGLLCPDMGTVGYGNAMHAQWFKTTPGHNTVTIGGANMARITGKLDGFEAHARYSAATASTDLAYPGWRLTRRILLGEGFLVDDYVVAGGKADTIDWFLRAPGGLSLSVEAKALGEKPLNATYAYLKDLRGARTDGDWTAVWLQGKEADAARLVVTMRGAAATEVAQADAPAPKGERWENLRVRRQGSSTRFTSVFQAVPQGGKPLEVAFEDGGVRVGDSRVVFPAAGVSLLKLE